MVEVNGAEACSRCGYSAEKASGNAAGMSAANSPKAVAHDHDSTNLVLQQRVAPRCRTEGKVAHYKCDADAASGEQYPCDIKRNMILFL